MMTAHLKMENEESPSLRNKIIKYCKICGDTAPRKYCGVLACDGCKSFFRRALRGKKVYKCRYDQNCHISKDKRTQCRQCRLKKCLEMGMKSEAIKGDREPIRHPKLPVEENPNTLTFATLVHADELVKGPSKLMLAHEMLAAGDKSLTTERKLATIRDHYNSVMEQLLVMVKWAESIPAFCELPKEDKVALLQAHASEYTMLALVRRSLPLTDILLMGNGYLLVRELKDVLGVIDEIIDELVNPYKDLNVDDTEFALLKGIMFFDPSARGLSDKKRILTLRRQAEALFEEYVIRDRQLAWRPGRLTEILLRFLPLQSAARTMSEQIHNRKFFGIGYIDKLLREMILGEDVILDKGANNTEDEEAMSRSTVIMNP